MSELINTTTCRRDHRITLLTTASALALLTSFSDVIDARADDADSSRPLIWIELGGQLERDNVLGEAINPPFLTTDSNNPTFPLSTIFKAQDVHFGFGGEGKISFQPQDSNWVFAASIRYGRSSNNRHIHKSVGVNFPTTSPLYNIEYTEFGHHSADTKLFADTLAKDSESHSVIDFQAGKDFGLGMFGSHSMSNLSFGVRFAQFSSKRDVSIRARPDLHFQGSESKYWHTYGIHEVAQRSFRGIGPSISWSNFAPVLGNSDNSEITLDWGINAAVLFGRQKAAVEHNATNRTLHAFYNPKYTTFYHPTVSTNRARFVTVPNAGAFAGLSFRYSSAKISLGYRGDFFFGAMDGGNDTEKKITPGFYGPFASISVGIGG
jgi:iron complex outermembrane recepter protein